MLSLKEGEGGWIGLGVTHTHTHTHTGIQSTVRASMEESLFQILSPKRRINILRDVMAREKGGRPYTITFCGVNGVGKSTNLAKVCVCVCVGWAGMGVWV